MVVQFTDLDGLAGSAHTDRRFEALILVGHEGDDGADLAALVEAGMRVIVVDPVAAGRHLGDAVRDACAELRRAGIGLGAVLVLARGLGSRPGDLDALRDHDLLPLTIASADLGPSRLPPGVVGLGGPGRLGTLLTAQLDRRLRHCVPAAVGEPGWCVVVKGFQPDRERVDEALLSIADGRIGVSGAPLHAAPGARRWVLVGGMYVGRGPEAHLVTAPVSFQLPDELPAGAELSRLLDLRSGLLYEDIHHDSGALHSLRFTSLARPGTAVLRVQSAVPFAAGSTLLAPEDEAVLDSGVRDRTSWMRVATAAGGVVAAASEEEWTGGGSHVLDRITVFDADANTLPDVAGALEGAHDAESAGFDSLLTEHRAAWSARWADADITVEGDDRLQLATRFALFNLMAAAPDCGEAAVGARGLSGQSYRGHVFWDADTFVLPFLAATHPAAARSMLEYRLRRLPAAKAAAKELGYAGARFPWESAGTGRDVTPTSARDRSGRLVPIRTGLLEEHIVAQVPWAACCYIDWTGDEEFANGPGLDLLIETARYWASRIRREPDGSAHIYGVIGPDEYHEPVDDNAFTNVMARWNLRRAAWAVETAPVDAGVGDTELLRWRALADALVDGWDPDTGIYEQFAGFSRLEPLIISEVAPRRPIAADLLLGAERVHGAQVLKQADVLMLHHLVPDEVVPGTLEANLRYYEPRTAHGSSLSPSIHASLFARARDFGPALDALSIASRIDLDDLTGSTAGGLHLATMGGLWQAFAFGFTGLRPHDGRLTIDPRLPRSWSGLEIRVRFRGRRVTVRTERGQATVVADAPVGVELDGRPYTAGPRGLQFHRAGPNWELRT